MIALPSFLLAGRKCPQNAVATLDHEIATSDWNFKQGRSLKIVGLFVLEPNLFDQIRYPAERQTAHALRAITMTNFIQRPWITRMHILDVSLPSSSHERGQRPSTKFVHVFLAAPASNDCCIPFKFLELVAARQPATSACLIMVQLNK